MSVSGLKAVKEEILQSCSCSEWDAFLHFSVYSFFSYCINVWIFQLVVEGGGGGVDR